MLLLYLTTALCGLVAVSIARAGGGQALLLIGAVGIVIALVLWKLGVLRMVGDAHGPRASDGEKPAERAGAAETDGGKKSLG